MLRQVPDCERAGGFILEGLFRLLGRLGSLLGGLGSLLGRPGAVLERSWGDLGSFSVVLGRPLGSKTLNFLVFFNDF